MEGMPPKYVSSSHDPAVTLGRARGGAVRRLAGEGEREIELVLNLTTGGQYEVKRRCAPMGMCMAEAEPFLIKLRPRRRC